jgi:hypothetical protein
MNKEKLLFVALLGFIENLQLNYSTISSDLKMLPILDAMQM